MRIMTILREISVVVVSLFGID